MHKENSIWHVNFISKQMRYIEYFFLIGLWRLKRHKSWAIVRYFRGSWSDKKTEPNEQRRDRNRQSDENSRFAFLLGVQKVIFLMQNGVARFSKLWFPTGAGSTFLKNDGKRKRKMRKGQPKCMR